MLRRNILLGVLFVICIVANAQQSKINLQLKHTLKQSKPDDVIALFVRGDVPKIKQTVETFGGKVKLSAKDVVQVELPSSTIEVFSKNDFVKSIEYSFFKGEILNAPSPSLSSQASHSTSLRIVVSDPVVLFCDNHCT